MKQKIKNRSKTGKKLMGPKLTENAGLTLIELLVAMAIFGMVIAGVVGAFYDQLRSHNTQQLILEMQQNARAAMYYITRELRMAGYDPTGDADSGITPDSVNRDTITFSLDITGGEADTEDNDNDGTVDNPEESVYGDGATDDANETITYALNGSTLTRNTGGGAQTLAINVDALDFVYHGVNPADPNDTDFLLSPAAASANPDNIRFVNITIITRAATVPVFGYNVRDTRQYRNLDGDMILNKSIAPDGFRRIMLRKQLKLRNMGLN